MGTCAVSPRAVAVQGLTFEPRLVATQGLSLICQPVRRPLFGGQMPARRRKVRHDTDDDVLLFVLRRPF